MRGRTLTRRLVNSTLTFGLLWFVLTEGDWATWLIGLPVILLASFTFLLWPAGRRVRLNIIGSVRFASVFAWRCLIAGIDVSRRAFGPRGAIDPGVMRYRMTLPDAASRTLLANTVSLLPGTLTTDIEGDDLRLHVLDRRADVLGEVAAFESLIAQLLARRGVVEQIHEMKGGAL